MKDLPAALLIEKNKLATPSAWLLLLELLLNDSAGTVRRFARNTEDVTWLTDYYYDTGCVRHFKLNDNAANTTVIDSAKGQNGTATRNTSLLSATGKINNCFDFDAAQNDTVNCGSDSDIDFDGKDFTICGWFKPTLTAKYRFVWNKQRTHLYLDKTDQAFVFSVYDGAYKTLTISKAVENKWYFAVQRHKGTEHKAWLYDENGLIASPSRNDIGTTTGDNDIDFIIGRCGFWSQDNDEFDGLIDNVMVFDRALTADEIAMLWSMGNGTERVPIVYPGWNFTLDQASDQAKGELPTWQLRVANVTRILEPYLEQLKGAVGSTVILTVVNSAHLTEDYAELQKTFDVMASQSDAQWVSLTLGAPNLLRQRFPLRRYRALHCWNRFETAECSYTRETVADVTLSGTDPVSIEVTEHPFATGDSIRLADIAGVTPSLDGSYTITKTDADNFTLDDTDSSDYSGTYTSGGTAGYTTCNRTLANCRQRQNSVHFGGCPGLRRGGLKIA
ncbi:MAG: hypothetical protein AMJ84_02930 [Acidithiobacillales bacterium SM23_46]|nr:MAG: hypothetical protein AMJ84_02930 [Acidithiobacillales bacterium SM23_46]